MRGHFRDALAAIMACSRALVNVSFHAASPALVVSMNSRSLAWHDVDATVKPLGRMITRAREAVGSRPS